MLVQLIDEPCSKTYEAMGQNITPRLFTHVYEEIFKPVHNSLIECISEELNKTRSFLTWNAKTNSEITSMT